MGTKPNRSPLPGAMGPAEFLSLRMGFNAPRPPLSCAQSSQPPESQLLPYKFPNPIYSQVRVRLQL